MTTSNPIQIILNENKTNSPMVNIDIIKSPMKYEILELLRHGEMNFEDIVENTKKSKASISMHLRDLRKEGIVNYKADLTDNRKKRVGTRIPEVRFYIQKVYLCSLNNEALAISYRGFAAGHRNGVRECANRREVCV